MYDNTHPEFVKASLRARYGTLEHAAEVAGVNAHTLRKSLRRCTPAGNIAIAKLLDTTPHALWPQWFDNGGARRLSRTLPE